ncbi:MAG: DUF3038 domain-containing protein [Cyanobacteria bacterium P01_A01_bin.105]
MDAPVPEQTPSLSQLENIKAQLDLILLSMEALVGLGSDAVLTTAKELNLDGILSDRVGLWRLRQASPLRKGQGRKKLDVDEARALVLIVCQLAASYHPQIRDAVARLETLTAEGKPPHRAAVLGDFIDNFSNTYQERMEADPNATPDELTALALQLLIDLLFYSGQGGRRRLWLALLDRSSDRSP